MKAKHAMAALWLVLGVASGCQGNDDVSDVNATQADSPDGGSGLELVARAAWRHHGTGGQLGSATGMGGTNGAAGSSGSAGVSETGGSSGTTGTTGMAGNLGSTGLAGSTGTKGSAGTIGEMTGSAGSTGTGLTIGGSTAGKVARPSYNTGKGFFVLNGKLYDPNGAEFRVRGVNKLHWDLYTPGIPASHANTERWDIDFTQQTATNIALMQTSIASHMVPMPGNWTGTCNTDPAVLTSIVDTWVAQESAWHAVDDKMIINVANEWGPEASTGTGWRDAYIGAVARLRAAGYLATISITSGGCGQDNADLAQYAQAVFNSDPQKNIIFDQHVYGNFSDPATLSWEQDFLTGMNALQATGLAIILGEFGPGRDIGPSPTMITPDQVIQAAEAHNLGWMAWAWDDNPAAGDAWYSLSNTGAFTSSADLTTFGKVVVQNPTYGLLALARANTAF